MSAFLSNLQDFLVLNPFLPGFGIWIRTVLPGSAGPYQSSAWIRIRNAIFQILDPDPYQNNTDPPH